MAWEKLNLNAKLPEADFAKILITCYIGGMTVTLLVDEIHPGGTLAVTRSHDKVINNIQQFGGEYFRTFKDRVDKSETGEYIDIFIYGRFLCVIQQTQNKKDTFMLFHDCENSRDKAAHVSEIFLKYPDGKNLRDKFMVAFLRLERNYAEVYNDIELSLDSSALS